MYPQSSLRPEGAEHQLSHSTQLEYLKICARFTNDTRELHEGVRSKNYAGAITAAFEYALEVCQAPRPDGLPVPYYEGFVDCVQLRGGPEKVASDLARVNRTDLAGREGRVKHLASLPRDWFPTFISATREECNLERAAILIVALSGCRACEVGGIVIRSKDAGIFSLFIPTAKKGPGKRPIRLLVFRSNELTAEILGLISEVPADYRRPFSGMKTARIRHLISKKVSQRAFGKDGPVVTASDLRNNFASLLKHAKWTKERIAAALGHSTTGTQKFYGRYYRATKATGYVPPAFVQGAMPVRADSTLESFQNPPIVPTPPRERN